MCGINGIVTELNDTKQKIPNLNRLLRHRGPDDEGYVFINSQSGDYEQYSGDDSINEIKSRFPHISKAKFNTFNVLLANRRLAIIDLSEKGHGPMSGLSGTIWLTYNGEIYNYIELREELQGYGYKFQTKSDTEVIVNSYVQWGADCLNKFNGMWAFAIWDSRSGQLFIARDRFGVKPLYFIHSGSVFAFSSEIKPLLYLQPNLFEMNREKIPFFILYGNRLSGEDTYFKNIHSLPASHYLVYKNNKITFKRYYDIKVFDKNNYDEKRACQKIVDILSDSIRLRYRSDVPVGSCLSGGFDSSTIVSLSNLIDKRGIHTFSAVWLEQECNESKYIDIVNHKYGCIENKVTPKAEEFESIFNKINYYQEIPTEGPGIYPQWYVMQRAKGIVKVLLDGQGGDEVFGGYFLMGAYLRGLIKDLNFSGMVSEAGNFLKFFNKQGVHSFSSWLFPQQYNKIAGTGLSEKFKIIKRDLLGEIDKEKLYNNLEPPKKFRNYINNLSYHFITNLTIPSLLHYEDRSSMAHSIESRVPFLDYRLVELGMNLAPNHLSYKDTSRPLYRKALIPYLPEEIVNRKDKLGFPTPFSKWSRTILKNYITDCLLSDTALISEFVDRSSLEQNLTKHFEMKKDFSWEIWRLLSLENSLKLYKSGIEV
ncbi:MAG: asparagine synthase (glutamine-hydrolyzing) [Chlorobi bacterium]|nr:asparagine synthase (glutamine-hydrolyzing) [Chlorobiota bacterium]MCI0714855.1 asparagine synthase (glutamine-hydrolyzing) [Chlorobiota bacterium]